MSEICNDKARETPFAIYTGLMVHAETKKKRSGRKTDQLRRVRLPA